MTEVHAMHARFTPLAIAAALLMTATHATAQNFQARDHAFRVEIVAEGLQNPWGMAMLPDGSMLVTERAGRLLLIADGKKNEIAGLPAIGVMGQGGLLDIVADEDFASSRRVFFTYAEQGLTGFSTALATATLSADDARLEGVKKLFAMSKKTMRGQHFGSRIVLMPDGTLFLTTGDRGEGRRAQDMRDHAGAVIRLNRDGSVPATNPFADGKDALPQLWSKGHRNPQGAARNPQTGELWTVEHGARGGDEINIPRAGLNYGWPEISYGVNYNGTKIGVGSQAPGFEQPIHYWDPSIAPSGMAFYSGDLFPQWKGDLFVGALRAQMLVRLDIEGGRIAGEERLLQGEFGRIRDVRVFPDGAIWLLTDEGDGQLLRLTPQG
jgi:glucose/arabinose dehydrogenase